MRLPLTLSAYISRQFALSVLIALGGLVAVTSLVDSVELIRRVSGKSAVPISLVIEMALLRLPIFVEKMTPYAVLIGSMLCLTRLTRTHELVVARAAGVSVWQFLLPALLSALVFGLFMMMAFNPLSSATYARAEQLDARYIKNRPSLISISDSGLWLRQMEEDKNAEVAERIIQARQVSRKDMVFSGVILFSFGHKSEFIERVDAETMQLQSGYWRLNNVKIFRPGQPLETRSVIAIKTDITMEQIQDSFNVPKTISFWQLPEFIERLEKAGFPALRHRLYFQGMLADPFMLAAMVLIAAVFSLRPPRRGKVGVLMVAGITTGITLRVIDDVIKALVVSGRMPLMLGAWAPAIVCIFIAVALLLHMEDG